MAFFRPRAQFTVAPGVHGFRATLANYYFVQVDPPGNWVLVDAGLRGGGPRLRREAAWRFGARQAPLAVLLTHGHFDHTGALPFLLRDWSCPVFAHRRELPFLNDDAAYPPPDPTVGGGLVALSSALFPRRPTRLPTTVLPLPPDGSVPGLPDWRWIDTAGHSPGHVSFWRERDRLLLAGDAVITTRQESLLQVWRQTPEVRPPPAYFTPNWRLAYEALDRLRALRPATLAAGHGLPLHGPELRQGLDLLADDFEARGLPARGHYVRGTWAH